MVFERYSDRMVNKLQTLNKDIYSKMMYKKVAELTDLRAFQTLEHYRSIPEVEYTPLKKGDRWGQEYGNIWIRGTFTVPKELEGKKLYVIPNTGAYETLFFINGLPQGIFNSKGDYMGIMHSAQLLTDSAVAGDTYELAFECYAGHYCPGCGPYDDYEHEGPNSHDYIKTFDSIDICVMNEIVHDFVFDLIIVSQMAKRLPQENSQRSAARNALEEVFANIIQYPKYSTEEEINASLQKCREAMAPVLKATGAENTRGKIAFIGHSHLDTAWLWPVAETVRKAARTYANVIRMMEIYPEYKFIQSSALHLDWMREYYPTIFNDIVKYVKEGRYEPNGGVWVECDCNITSGELMARQFLYGQLYTRKYLDYTSDTFWLPDTFGYNAAIPQIMRESEVKYFCTTKMGWNDMNRFPFTTFNWKGIDGSTVLTHLHSIDIIPDVDDIVGQIEGIANKKTYDGRLFPFGHGDGGGGPTPATIEKARRVKDVPGLPKTYYSTVSDFMQDIEKNAVDVPTYSGELYLELHRGTLTQMHDIKRYNRKTEFALRDMDYMNVLADKPKGEKTDELYKVLLKNQFHDILPGTCNTGVTQLAVSELKEVIEEAGKITENYAQNLTEGEGVTLFNTTSFDRDDVQYLEAEEGKVAEGLTSQVVTDATGKKLLAVGGLTIPALSAKSVKLVNGTPEIKSSFSYKDNVLTTPFAKVTFDQDGFISSFIDLKSGRELRRPGAESLGVFMVGEDVPNYWDNWDIDYDIYLKMKPQKELLEREVIADGALEFRIRSKYKIGKSSVLTQVAIFYANTPRVDFHTVIDWNEKHTLLKVSFDVDINSTVAKHEIQFGHIERTTTRNNTIEAARFEVCNHKWTALSDSRFGVAILNDCKYGISVLESNISLTLHRGGTRPDMTGDAGVHEMTYSLLPHNGPFTVENVVKPSYLLNVPTVKVPGTLKAHFNPIIELSADNIVVEAIKPAELRDDAFVVRMYEAERTKTFCDVKVPAGTKKVYLTNILEDIKEELEIVDGKVKVTFNPFQIRTLMFVK